MSLTPMSDPQLTGPQILSLLAYLDREQIAAVQTMPPAITGPLGFRLMSSTSPAGVLAAIPDSPRRQLNPFSY